MKYRKISISLAVLFTAILFASSLIVVTTSISSGSSQSKTVESTDLRISNNSGFLKETTTQGTATTENWAGYLVASSLSNPQPVFYEVDGSWIVQTPAGHFYGTETYSSQWIGIGGWFSNTLIQVGTESNAHNYYQNSYYAWYEMLPTSTQAGNSSNVKITSLAVHSGDVIDASISEYQSSSEWTIYIQDVTTGQSYQNNFHYSPDMKSAEWIEERPTVNGNYANLANFGTAYFGPQYTSGYYNRAYDTNGYIYDINSLPYDSISMYDSSGTLMASPSSLGSDGNSFTVTWHSST